MARYRLAIFDFDGTWPTSTGSGRPSTTSSRGSISRRSTPTNWRHSARCRGGKSWRGLKCPSGGCRVVADMRRRKLESADTISLFDGVPHSSPACTAWASRPRSSVPTAKNPSGGCLTKRGPDLPLRLQRFDLRQAQEVWVCRTTTRNETRRHDLHWRRDPRHRGCQEGRHALRGGDMGLYPFRGFEGQRTNASVQLHRRNENKARCRHRGLIKEQEIALHV